MKTSSKRPKHAKRPIMPKPYAPQAVPPKPKPVTDPQPFLSNARIPHRPTVKELWKALLFERSQHEVTTKLYEATMEAKLARLQEAVEENTAAVQSRSGCCCH